MSGENVSINQFTLATAAPVAGDYVAGWQTTASQTVRFLATQIAAGVYAQPVAVTAQTTATAAGAAGTVDALPTTPLGYLEISINGVACKLAYYNT